MADPNPPAADDREILRRRAIELARPVVVVEERAGIEVLFLRAGAETFALETRFVRTITALPPISPVPDLPGVFLGVANHGGEILPVVDLVTVLGSGRTEAPTLLVVVGDGRPDVGLAASVADRVERVADLAPPPARDPLVLGVHGEGCLVFDGAALLASPRLHAAPDPA